MKTLACLFLLLTWAVAPLTAADTVEIKQRWVAGKQYYFSMQSGQQITMNMGAQQIDQTVTMIMEMNVAVRPHEDGKRKRLSIRYDRVAMEMAMNGQKMGYDSAKPGEGNDPMGLGKAMGATVGKELKVLTNEQDEIAEIENYDEYIKQITPEGGGAMDMTKTFSRKSLLHTMKQGSLQAFPLQSVAAGESWPFANQLDLPQVGTISIKGTYTYKGMVDRAGVKCAEIQTAATIGMDLAAGAAGQAMGVTEGTLEGPVWFDLQLGMARESDLQQNMTMSMKSPVDPTVTMAVPMKQTIKTSLVKVVDLK